MKGRQWKLEGQHIFPLFPPTRTPREHEGACGSCQQSHEDGRLEDLPHIYHQWEDEQQGLGPVSWDSESARDAGQVRGKKKKRPRSIHLYPSFFFDRSAKLHSLTCIRSTGKSRKSHWELIFSHTAVCMTPSGKRRGLPSTKRVQLGPYLSSHYVHRKF